MKKNLIKKVIAGAVSFAMVFGLVATSIQKVNAATNEDETVSFVAASVSGDPRLFVNEKCEFEIDVQVKEDSPLKGSQAKIILEEDASMFDLEYGIDGEYRKLEGNTLFPEGFELKDNVTIKGNISIKDNFDDIVDFSLVDMDGKVITQSGFNLFAESAPILVNMPAFMETEQAQFDVAIGSLDQGPLSRPNARMEILLKDVNGNLVDFTSENRKVKVEYLEQNEENENFGKWIPLTENYFGPAEGFPVYQTTNKPSQFRAVFDEAGEYTLDLKLVGVKDNGVYGKQEGTKVTVNHKDLIYVDRVEPTADKDGNIGYWYCNTCDKYYKDSAGKLEISKEDTVIPATGETDNAPAIKDENTGITLDPTNKLPEGAELSVKEMTKEEIAKDPAYSKIDNLLAVYDINVMKDGKVEKISGNKMKITIPLTDELKGYKYYQVVYIKDGKIAERIDASIENGNLVFYTNHLSEYGILGSNTPFEKIESEENSPKTNDPFNMVALMLLLGTSAFGVLKLKEQ